MITDLQCYGSNAITRKDGHGVGSATSGGGMKVFQSPLFSGRFSDPRNGEA